MMTRKMNRLSKEERNATVKSSPFNMTEFSKHIADMMGVEWTERYSERIKQYLYRTGSSKPSPEEEHAMDLWCYVQTNPVKMCQVLDSYKAMQAIGGTVADVVSGRRRMAPAQSNQLAKRIRGLLKE